MDLLDYINKQKKTQRLNDSPIKKLECDPFLYFLNVKVGLAPWHVGLLFIIIGLVIILIAFLTDVWCNITYPLVISYHTWIGDVILGITNALILKFYLSFPVYLNNLYEKKILEGGNEQFESFYNLTVSKFNNKARHISVIIISLITSIALHYSFQLDDYHGWTEINSTDGLSFLGYYHLVYFTIELSIILNFILNIYSTIRIFHELEYEIISGNLEFKFVRLCPFNSGGLKPLGDLAMKIVMVLFMLGLYISLIVYSILSSSKDLGYKESWQYIEIFIPLPLYVIIAPTVFFLLLVPIHRLMRFKKQALYELLIEKDQEITNLEIDSIKTLYSKSENFQKLKFNTELFNLINELPTWPFNINAITKLITMTLIPIAPFILQLIHKLIW